MMFGFKYASLFSNGGALVLDYRSVSFMPFCFLGPVFAFFVFVFCLSLLFSSANCNNPTQGLNNVKVCSNSCNIYPAPLPIKKEKTNDVLSR